jgi:hypothetical protein
MTYANFEDFWPDYVRAHSNKLNRALHVLGMSLALACALAAIKKKKPWLLLGVPVLGYGFAWCGHFFVQGNVPATFSHPLYSLRASVLLFWKTLDGSIEAEVERILTGDEAEAPAAGAEPAASSASSVN